MRLGLNIEVIIVDLWISTPVQSAKHLTVVTLFLGIPFVQRPPACQRGHGQPRAEQGRFCLAEVTVFRHPPVPRSWQQKHTRTRETKPNSCCTQSWRSDLRSSSSPTTRHLSRLRWFRSNTHQAQHPAWHMQGSQMTNTEQKQQQMYWYPCKFTFSVSSLGLLSGFFLFVLNSQFDSIFSCDFIYWILKPCKPFSFKTICVCSLWRLYRLQERHHWCWSRSDWAQSCLCQTGGFKSF